MESERLLNPVNNDSDNEQYKLRMILIGRAGAGKSATGNSILGEKLFLSEASPPLVTMECVRKEKNRFGRLLVVVDTPGFFDTKTPKQQMNKDLRECLDLCRPGPRAIVLVLQVGRFTQEEKESVQRIQSLFGVEALKLLVIVFSRKEDLKKKTIEEYVEEAEPALKEIIAKCGDCYCAFNNEATGDENEQQVFELIEIIEEKFELNEGDCTPEAPKGLVNCDQDTKMNEIRIVLVGKTGVGKSASGNSILGGEAFTSRASLKSVTKDCERKACTFGDKDITVVDTPGLFDTKMSLEEIVKELAQCVVLSSPGPHAIILVIQVGRFTKEEEEAVKLIRYQFGRKAVRYIIVLFTRVEDLVGQSLEEFVSEAEGPLKGLIEAYRGRCCGFNNRATGEEQEKQRLELVTLIERMVRGNGGGCYTQQMYQQAEKAIKRSEEALKREIEEKKAKEEKRMKEEYEQKKKAMTDKRQRENIDLDYQRNQAARDKEYAEELKYVPRKAENIVLKLIGAGFAAAAGGAVGALCGLALGPVGMLVGAVIGAAAAGGAGAGIGYLAGRRQANAAVILQFKNCSNTNATFQNTQNK